MRQNLTIALLSVIATLLLLLVVQNFHPGRHLMLAQGGGSSGATVGTIGVATGTLQGSDAAGFFIYDPTKERILLYDYNNNKLRLKAVRDVQFDVKLVDFSPPGQVGPTVNDVKSLVSKKQ
jgi:hypothetical protein